MSRKPITPVNSPQKDKYGDRFIPSRAGNNWQVNFNLIQVRDSLKQEEAEDAEQCR